MILRDLAEEKRVTRATLEILAELAKLPEYQLRVRDDVLLIPEGLPEDLEARIRRLEPYLRWAAGKEANAWGPGGPMNLPVLQSEFGELPMFPIIPERTPVQGGRPRALGPAECGNSCIAGSAPVLTAPRRAGELVRESENRRPPVGLRHRLDRLERGEGRLRSANCPECQLWPASGYGRVFYTDDGSSGPASPAKPPEPALSEEQEWCSGCGRPKFFFIRVVFDPDEEEEGA